MFDYCPFLCPICGNEMDGLRPIHNPFTNDQMIVIDCEHCETHFEFHDSWDEVLAKLKYAYNEFPADEDMEKAFAALADELEAQDEELLQEVVDVLTVWRYMRERDNVADGIYSMGALLIGENGMVHCWNDTESATAISQAAEWVRQQGGGDA